MSEFLRKANERTERELAPNPIAILYQNSVYVAPRAVAPAGVGYTVTNGLEMFVQREPSELTGDASTIELPEVGCLMLKDALIADCLYKKGEHEQAMAILPKGLSFEALHALYGGANAVRTSGS